VVSFHSLEDRMVKQFLIGRSTAAPRASRHAPVTAAPKPIFELITHRPRTPSAAEIESNPRARSAKLRAGLKLAA
jgi:16S rRNA (cytosine1402-N4)-methyltransferase